MRIAVTTNGKKVSEQFGRIIKFTIFEVSQGKIREKLLVDISVSGGQEALVHILKNEGVKVLLCGEISEAVRGELVRYNIEVISGLKGNIRGLIRAYTKGYLEEA